MTVTGPTTSGNRRIAQLGWLLSSGLVTVLLLILAVSVVTVQGIREVDARWNAYDLGAAAKADALSDLRGVMWLIRRRRNPGGADEY